MNNISNKKKLIVVINNLGIGGAENVFVQEINSFVGHGYEIHLVVLYGGEKESPLLKNLSLSSECIVFLRAKNIYDFSAHRNFRKFIKSKKDAVIYSTLDDAIFFSRIGAMGTSHRLVTREANITDKKSIKHKIADIIFSWRVNSIIVVSKEVGRSLFKYQPWLKHKTIVLHNGVEIPSVSDSVRNENVVLTVGSLTPKKNQLLLLRAFKNISIDFPDAKLRIVGDGELRGSLERFVYDNGLAQRVSFLGNMDRKSLFDEYKNAGIFVLSSNQEGCPNALLEAMSYGTPSISTSVGAVSEIIDDGVCGFIVPKNDANVLSDRIKTLLSNYEQRQLFSLRSREKIAKDFSFSIHMSRLDNILF